MAWKSRSGMSWDAGIPMVASAPTGYRNLGRLARMILWMTLATRTGSLANRSYPPMTIFVVNFFPTLAAS